MQVQLATLKIAKMKCRRIESESSPLPRADICDLQLARRNDEAGALGPWVKIHHKAARSSSDLRLTSWRELEHV